MVAGSVLLALTAGSVTAVAAAPGPSLAAGVERAQRSVVLVVACLAPPIKARCREASAFAVLPHLFVTAAHAVGDRPDITVSTDGVVAWDAGVVAVDRAHDLALLRSPLPGTPLRLLAGTRPDALLATPCQPLALTQGDGRGRPDVYLGTLDGGMMREDTVLLARLDGAPETYGCSGSPAVDGDGSVVGVVAASDGSNAGIVPAADVAQLAARVH